MLRSWLAPHNHPINANSSTIASLVALPQLTVFYDKDIFASHHLSNISGRSVASLLENLPEENVTRRHFIMLLYPKFTKVLLHPKQYRGEAEGENGEY